MIVDASVVHQPAERFHADRGAGGREAGCGCSARSRLGWPFGRGPDGFPMFEALPPPYEMVQALTEVPGCSHRRFRFGTPWRLARGSAGALRRALHVDDECVASRVSGACGSGFESMSTITRQDVDSAGAERPYSRDSATSERTVAGRCCFLGRAGWSSAPRFIRPYSPRPAHDTGPSPKARSRLEPPASRSAMINCVKS